MSTFTDAEITALLRHALAAEAEALMETAAAEAPTTADPSPTSPTQRPDRTAGRRFPMSMPVPERAGRIRPRDIITVHPDTRMPVEYHVTRHAYKGEFGACHIEYRDDQGRDGELVLDAVTHAGIDTWVTVIPAGSGLLRDLPAPAIEGDAS